MIEVIELIAARGTLDNKGARKFTLPLRVKTDSLQQGPAAILDSGVLDPYKGNYSAGLDNDPAATFKSFSFERLGGDAALNWLITAEYSTAVDDQQSEPNPLLRPPEISFGFNSFQRVADKDKDGVAITNAAGQPFDPPLEIEDSRPVINIVRNEVSFNAYKAIDYQDSINSDQWFGLDPGQARLRLSARRMIENEFGFFWQVTYDFELRRDGWQPALLEQGYMQLVGGQLRDIVEPVTRQKVTKPQLLAANGTLLPPLSAPVFTVKKPYKERPFGPLGLV